LPSPAIDCVRSSEQRTGGGGAHLPALQAKPDSHSLSATQVALHLFVGASHAKLPGQGLGGRHAPFASHTEICPATQPAPQVRPALGYEQLAMSVPSQVPVHATSSPAQPGRGARGAPFTGTHDPTLPGSAHAWH
jgi:hypothetical protein